LVKPGKHGGFPVLSFLNFTITHHHKRDSRACRASLPAQCQSRWTSLAPTNPLRPRESATCVCRDVPAAANQACAEYSTEQNQCSRLQRRSRTGRGNRVPSTE